MRPKKSHSDKLAEICIVCRKKKPRDNNSFRPVSKFPALLEIVKLAIDDYDTINHHLPSSFCGLHFRAGKFTSDDVPDYKDWICTLSHISVDAMSSTSCTCFVCTGSKDAFGKNAKSTSVKRGRPKSSSTPPPSTSDAAKANEAMQTLSSPVRLMVTAETIKQQQMKKSSGSPVRLGSASGGPKAPVLFGAEAIQKVHKEGRKSAQISISTFNAILNERNRSIKDVLDIAKVIRKELGKNSIESGLADSLIENGKILKEFFNVKTMKMWVRNESKELVQVEKTVAYCVDIPKFVAYIMNQRGMENCTLKIGMDFGQKFFKICLTLMEADDDDTQLSIGMELAKLEVGYYTINCGLNKLSPFCVHIISYLKKSVIKIAVSYCFFNLYLFL